MVRALIAIGANLPSRAGSARATCEAAVDALAQAGLRIVARSRWFESPPDPPSDQPWYVNGVVAVETALSPPALLARMNAIEARFGRERTVRNAARTLDLDLIDYGGEVRPGPEPPLVPHPRLEGRAFVLRPLADVAPGWRHPVSGASLAELLARLPADTVCRPLPDQAPPVQH